MNRIVLIKCLYVVYVIFVDKNFDFYVQMVIFFQKVFLKIKIVIYDFDCSGWMKFYNNFMLMVNVIMELNYVLIRVFFYLFRIYFLMKLVVDNSK